MIKMEQIMKGGSWEKINNEKALIVKKGTETVAKNIISLKSGSLTRLVAGMHLMMLQFLLYS